MVKQPIYRSHIKVNLYMRVYKKIYGAPLVRGNWKTELFPTACTPTRHILNRQSKGDVFTYMLVNEKNNLARNLISHPCLHSGDFFTSNLHQIRTACNHFPALSWFFDEIIGQCT